MKHEHSLPSVLVVCFLLVLGGSPLAAQEWLDSLDTGLAKARQTKMLVLIDFNATWCGWCTKLEREVFEDSEFRKLATERFVTVRLDSDRDASLVEKFGVRGYPSCVVLHSDGREIGRIRGFKPRAEFLDVLRKIVRETIQEPLTAAEEKRGVIQNSVGMKLVPIPPGTFQMGSVKGDADENPKRKITIRRSFYLGQCEVTVTEWQRVMGGEEPSPYSEGLPMGRITWNQAQDFCRTLSRKEGKTYRLPTEAEWEYACRAGSTSEFFWGDSFDADMGWCETNSKGQLQPVKGRSPNAWGLYDIAGNQWEWCSDWYSPETYQSGAKTDPQGPENGPGRVLRGGSFSNDPRSLRSANRLWANPTVTYDNYGFRVVLEGN